MIENTPGLMDAVRARFAHIDECPFTGPRIFFENAGGALTLKSVVDTSAKYAAIPDNQGRDNPASKALVADIAAMRAKAATLFGATDGQIIVGESGTELLFRLISVACLGRGPGAVIGSTLEHPASRSAAKRWAEVAGKRYIEVAHDDGTGTVTAEAYAAAVTPDCQVATIIHTSPVTGIGADVRAVARAIRAVAPDCLIVVDGIQHAAHGDIAVADYGVDGYVISPYKMFSRHGYGVAWVGPRLEDLPHDKLIDGPDLNWELGTRDTGSYATFSDVCDYIDWLGGQVSQATDPRDRIAAAAKAIHTQEHGLTNAMIHGTDNLPGLADLPGVQIIGGADNPHREGLVCFYHTSQDSAAIVEHLNTQGIRCHIRKADHYSGGILKPLGQPDAVRVSLCHYNTLAEVRAFLAVMSVL